ncbi:MAG: hypothetical protein R6X09_01580, partial [Bacteroidales bacterium]
FWNQANRIVRRKKRRHSRHLAFYAIKKKLDRNDTFSRLSDFVVTHYNRQQSLVLLNMLSEEYHNLCRKFDRVSQRLRKR